MSQAWSLPPCEGSNNWNNCYGTYTQANRDKYVGEWKGGKMHGQGTYSWANHDKYVGEWKNHKRTGQGTYTWPNGEIWQGQWKNDEWVSGNKYAAGIDQRIQDQKEAKRKKELAKAEVNIRKLKAEREAKLKAE